MAAYKHMLITGYAHCIAAVIGGLIEAAIEPADQA